MDYFPLPPEGGQPLLPDGDPRGPRRPASRWRRRSGPASRVKEGARWGGAAWCMVRPCARGACSSAMALGGAAAMQNRQAEQGSPRPPPPAPVRRSLPRHGRHTKQEAPAPAGPVFLNTGWGVTFSPAGAPGGPPPAQRRPLPQRQHGRASMEETYSQPARPSWPPCRTGEGHDREAGCQNLHRPTFPPPNLCTPPPPA